MTGGSFVWLILKFLRVQSKKDRTKERRVKGREDGLEETKEQRVKGREDGLQETFTLSY